jgi:hypothetical protein
MEAKGNGSPVSASVMRPLIVWALTQVQRKEAKSKARRVRMRLLARFEMIKYGNVAGFFFDST